MNSIDTAHVFMRSMATRESTNEIPNALPGFIHAFISYDYDLIIIETPGIGQEIPASSHLWIPVFMS